MAITEYYVDPSIAGDSGTGTLGDPYGDLQYALNTVTRDATNGDRFNVKAGTDEVLGAALDLSTYGTPDSAAPLAFQGYTSAQGDGGIGSVSGAGSYSVIASATIDYVRFFDMKLYNSGANPVVQLDNHVTMVNCEVSTATGNGIECDTNANILNCYVHNVGGIGIDIGNNSHVSNCYIDSGDETNDVTAGINTGASVVCHNIVKVDGNSDGITCGSINAKIFNNTVWSAAAGGGTGVGLDMTGATYTHAVYNNIIEGFNTGIATALAADIDFYQSNRFYNNNTTEDITGQNLYEADNSTLSSSPFSDPANGDFSASADVKEDAWPSSFNGSSTNQYLDLGAAQIVGGVMASGDTLLILAPGAQTPESTAPAKYGGRGDHPLLFFDADTPQYAAWSFVIPQSYDGGGTTVKVHFAMTSATSGNVVLRGAWEAPTDLDSSSYASSQTVTVAVAGNSGDEVIGTLTFTDGAQMDSVAAGDRVRFRLDRHADSGSDTATGNMELTMVEIRNT